MKKYICVLLTLFTLVVLAAGHTYLDWGNSFFAFASQNNRELPPPMPQTADRPLMPPVHAPETTIAITVSPMEGMAINPLTGLRISEEAANRRPFAIVFGNSEISLPQSGLSQADIITEVISEGVTTRVIGIFTDFDSQRIGSIRSARHYFIDISLDYDAFFVHFGGSPQTFQAIRNLGTHNINGIQLDGGVRDDNFENVVFWRDRERHRVARLREHSAYTSAANLIRRANEAGFRMENIYAIAPFNFYARPNNHPYAVPANEIRVNFVANTPVTFIYNEETRRYYRYYGANLNPQIDEETGEQLAVENVIVQLTTVTAIPGDAEGRRNVAVVGEGTGYLFTNGTAMPLVWSKACSESPTEWYFEDGQKLTLNRGSTWICITNREPIVE